MSRIVNKWLKIVQQISHNYLTLPSQCVLCLQPSLSEYALCEACEIKLPWIKQPCQRCGMALKSPQTLCMRCYNEPPAFDRLYALFEYVWPVNAFIAKLKYAGRLPFGYMLGALLAKHLTPTNKPDCLLALPLFHRRQQERGFNQTHELARVIAKRYSLPFDWRSCTKIRETTSQVLLTGRQRANNIQAKDFFIAPTFKAKHVLVIEDVVTTMATVNAFSLALKQHGVSTVEIWSVCRTSM
ncbi:MAG: ComF family protein [Proteobacteria bacterium]|nr:ComF family protein [Pseudomonadota bacterium]